MTADVHLAAWFHFFEDCESVLALSTDIGAIDMPHLLLRTGKLRSAPKLYPRRSLTRVYYIGLAIIGSIKY